MIVEKQSEPQRTPKRHWWRFSLKTLLIVLTLFCIWLGTLANSANRQKRAVEAIQRSSGEFNYDYQQIPSRGDLGQAFSHRVDPPGPAWLRRILGEHYFITPVAMRMSGAIANDCLSHLAALPMIENASFGSVTFRGEDFVHVTSLRHLRFLSFHKCTFLAPRRFDALAKLTNLKSFSLSEPTFGDDDARYLSTATKLTHLFLYETSVGDQGVSHFQNLRQLKMLGLSRTAVTDEAVVHLSTLPALEYLSIGTTAVSNASIDWFAKMPALREIELHETRVTRDGIARLRSLLPRCRVNGQGGEGSVVDSPF